MNELPTSNFVTRYTKQSYDGFTSATKVRASNRKLIYSRYKESREFKSVGNDVFWSCAFTADDQCLLVGSENGKISIFNKYNNNVIAQEKVCPWFVNSLVPHNSGELLLTSSVFHSKSALLNIKNNFENQFKLNGCHHAEFTHAYDKVLGSLHETAKIYDLNSGQVIQEFKPAIQQYRISRAALDPFDKLLFTNPNMFDVRSGKEVHTFNKMKCFMNGTFHSNGLEIICSSEIWDLRMFHLLQTVENLEKRNAIFNKYGDVIFGLVSDYYVPEIEVIDAIDYSRIATIDIRHTRDSFAINPTDTQIAVAEDSGNVRLFDIGMVRHEEELDA